MYGEALEAIMRNLLAIAEAMNDFKKKKSLKLRFSF